MNDKVPAEVFCSFCGSDRDTDESVLSGFLTVPVVTPEHGPAVKHVCDACLAMVLAVVLARSADAGVGALLAQAVIENEQEEA